MMIDVMALAKQNNPDLIVSMLEKNGIITPDDACAIIHMTHKQKVMERHNHRITQGGGKDKRWFTRIDTPETKNKLLAASSEESLYEKLYDFYFESEIRFQSISLLDLYPEWLRYKYETSNRPNNVRRIDTDFKKYFLDEAVSQEILTKPLAEISAYDLKFWAARLVKKYGMTKKQFGNVIIPLRQGIDMLVDQGLFPSNPTRTVRFDQSIFRQTGPKKLSDTQVFYPDETEQILKCALEKARKTKDESFISIIICAYTGVRPGECAGLSFDDFDRKTNRVLIHRSLAAKQELLPDGTWSARTYEIQEYLKKNAKPRIITVPDICFDMVDEIRSILKDKGIERKYLFDIETPNNIEMKLYRICDHLQIPRRSPNKLRMTYVSTLLNHNFDLDFVRQQAGHSTLQTTLNHYTYSTTRQETLVQQLNSSVGKGV